MNKPSVDLASCDHKTFDEHYLRAFAERLPFFFRPGLGRSPFTVKNVVSAVETKLFPAGKPLPVSRVHGDRRLVRIHIAYAIADEMLCAHSGQRELKQSFRQLEYQFDGIQKNKALVMAYPSHPLFRHPDAKNGESTSGRPIRCLPAKGADAKIADWALEYPLQKLVAERVPELLSLDPDCDVTRRADEVRAELMQVLSAKKKQLTQKQRGELFERLFAEWVNMPPENYPTSKLEVEIESDLDSDDVLRTIKQIALACDKSEEAFKRYLPLLEELILKQAMTGNNSEQASIVSACLLLKKYGYAICDFPSLGTAQLAYKVRFADERDILSSL